MTSYIHVGIKVADGSKYFQSFTLQVKVTYNPEFKIIQKNQRVRRPTVRPQKGQETVNRSTSIMDGGLHKRTKKKLTRIGQESFRNSRMIS